MADAKKISFSRFVCVEYKMWICRKNALQGYIYYLFLANQFSAHVS